MVGIIFYILYFLLIFSTVYFFKQKSVYVIYPLIITSQFNVTSFLKLGITISYFEANLFLLTFLVLFFYIKDIHRFFGDIKLYASDGIWISFLIFGIISLFIGLLRVFFDDLHPDPYISPSPIIRGFMSLNKIFVFLPLFFIIRKYLIDNFSLQEINRHFIKAMVLAGVLPCLAVIVQFSGIGFNLIHNNPSFSETFRIEDYLGARPAGLTNEASFFVYQLFFSNLALFYGYKKKWLSRNITVIIGTLFFICVVLSISRLGQLLFVMFYAIEFGRFIKIFSIRGFLKMVTILPLLIILLYFISTLNVGGFNVGQRFTSSFQVDADLSTIERYGSSEALFNMLVDKSLLLGIGIYNFQYYIKDYLPSYMDVLYYGKGEGPASFNFVLQMMVEYGLIGFLVYVTLNFTIIKKTKNLFVQDWYLYLLIFSLSFQVLNFAIPFVIMFFITKDEKDSIYS